VAERDHFGNLARDARTATARASGWVINLFDRAAQFKLGITIRTDVFIIWHSSLLLLYIAVSILLGFTWLRNCL
jgi:hypothetical protein